MLIAEDRLAGGRQQPAVASRRAINFWHQTPILSSCGDLPAAWEAVLKFGRWRQENVLKYVKVPLGLYERAGYHWPRADGREPCAPLSAIRWSWI